MLRIEVIILITYESQVLILHSCSEQVKEMSQDSCYENVSVSQI